MSFRDRGASINHVMHYWRFLTPNLLRDFKWCCPPPPSTQITHILFIASYSDSPFFSKLIEYCFKLIVWKCQVAKGGSIYGKGICKNPKRYTWNKDTTTTYSMNKIRWTEKTGERIFWVKLTGFYVCWPFLLSVH